VSTGYVAALMCWRDGAGYAPRMSGGQRGAEDLRAALWVVLDCAAAALLLAVSVRGAAVRMAGAELDFSLPGWLVVAAAAVAAGPVAIRRLWPAAVFVAVLAANTVVVSAGVSGNAGVPVALVVYTVAVSRPPRWSVPMMTAALVLTSAAELTGMLAGPQPPGWQIKSDVVAATIAVIPGAWALGAAVRARRLGIARALRQAADQAVATERLRVARELHDVITHSMTLITVKASTANYLIDSRPAEVRPALTVIETTGRVALAELRRMLGVLRASGAIPTAGRDGGDLMPAPGLGDLTAMAEHAAGAGVSLELVLPAEHDLPDGVALAVYRIVQEAVTNVIKHAAPTHCEVRVSLTGHDVVVDVTDAGQVRPAPILPPARHGRRARPATGGLGIIGMRERATIFGGEFEAGPLPDGGFRVTARLPLGTPVPGNDRAHQ